MTEEEIKRLRSYLEAQSMRCTPAQLTEALQVVYHQFTTMVTALPGPTHHEYSDEQRWSVFEIVEHAYLFLLHSQKAICGVLQTGDCPSDVNDRQEIIPHGGTRGTPEEILVALQEVLNHLIRAVLQAEPLAHLDMT